MARRGSSGLHGSQRHLLRAKPLSAELAHPIQPGAAAPIPVPVPTTTPARPIPVTAGTAHPARPIPLGSIPAPAAPMAPAAPPANRPIILTEQQKKQRAPVVAARPGYPLGPAAGRSPDGGDGTEEAADAGALALWWREFVAHRGSWAFLISLLVHFLAVTIFALITYHYMRKNVQLVAVADPIDQAELDQLEELQVEGPKIEPRGGDIVDRAEPEPLQPLIDHKNAAEGIDAASQQLSRVSMEFAPYNDLLCELGAGTGKANQYGTGKGKRGFGFGLDGTGLGLGGRGGRRGKATGSGATKESEASVDLALKWLADHQLPDGGWSFNHQLAPTCKGQCPNPGQLAEARIAATAFGLLPFLGAGQTNQVGKYQRTVAGGLNYLIQHMRLTPEGGKLNEPGGRMYAHGLATIALCEAYAMQVNPSNLRKLQAATYDGSGQASPSEAAGKPKDIPVANLGPAAQAALNFVMSAQDPGGGGWRYEPRQPGDTSVVGWQLMALMSGRMAYLRVNPNAFVGAGKFLDHVQRDDYGADYGYTDKGRGTAATQAIGLLCRMYLGWKRDHPGLSQGVENLSHTGPRQGDMYYNYYATQVLHHAGGELWEQWNPRMRDSLVGTQSKAGHTAGSWHFAPGDQGSHQGGRLYCTAMAAMTLEVYYRHMPLYREGVLGEPPAKDKQGKPAAEEPDDGFRE